MWLHEDAVARLESMIVVKVLFKEVFEGSNGDGAYQNDVIDVIESCIAVARINTLLVEQLHQSRTLPGNKHQNLPDKEDNNYFARHRPNVGSVTHSRHSGDDKIKILPNRFF